MTGTLFLLPNRIADRPPQETLPEGVLQTARASHCFLAENAKSARAYLKAVGHPAPIASLSIVEIGHEPDPARFGEWLSPALAGNDICLVSESGCPCIADPGAALVAFARQKGIPVKPLVGPNSMILTLMASGLNGQRFRFLGYLPKDKVGLVEAIRAMEKESRTPETQLFIETPYRNTQLLQTLVQTLQPDTRITVATDLTGNGESVRTMSAREWQGQSGELPKLPTVFAVLAARHGAGNAGIKIKKPFVRKTPGH